MPKKMAKQKSIPTNTINPEHLKYINKQYPDRHPLIYKRSIHHVFDEHYRINFQQKYSPHLIKLSYFCTVLTITDTPKINQKDEFEGFDELFNGR